MGEDERETQTRELIVQAKALAVKYYALTGKPLGVTGEVAELAAAEHLGLRLVVARTAYYDAERTTGGSVERFQVKGRAVKADDLYRGRLSTTKTDGDYEYVVLVLLDVATFDCLEIWQATRLAVAERLGVPGSKARNERGSLGISQFKSIAERVWVCEARAAISPTRLAPRPLPVERKTSAHGGPIGSLVKTLLLDASLDYAQIVSRVKLEFPGAQTSTKSVASTARDLRRLGKNIPARIQVRRH